MSSDFVRLKQEIQLRCQAAKLGLTGYADVSKHQTIERKYNAIGECLDELKKLVGPEKASSIVTSIYQSVMEVE